MARELLSKMVDGYYKRPKDMNDIFRLREIIETSSIKLKQILFMILMKIKFI